MILDERVAQLGLAALNGELSPPELLYTCKEDDEAISETDPGEAIHAHMARLIAGGDKLPSEIRLYAYVRDDDEHASDGLPVRLVFTHLISVRGWSYTNTPDFLGRIESE